MRAAAFIFLSTLAVERIAVCRPAPAFRIMRFMKLAELRRSER